MAPPECCTTCFCASQYVQKILALDNAIGRIQPVLTRLDIGQAKSRRQVGTESLQHGASLLPRRRQVGAVRRRQTHLEIALELWFGAGGPHHNGKCLPRHPDGVGSRQLLVPWTRSVTATG